MSDELNVWTFEGCSIGEYRNAEYAKGYQQAIADVVEWLTKERLSDTADHYAQLITRRFGKG